MIHAFRNIATLALLVAVGCSRHKIHAPQAVNAPALDNSYTDLKGGCRLSILIPLTKSGTTRPTLTAQQNSASTISLSAADLTGYEVAYYAISGRRNGAVRLKFMSAEITREGKTLAELNPPTLPFVLPTGSEHIRLIYLVRASQADHNMAIIASKHLDALNTFTKELKEHPGSCARNDEVACSWVPGGIAVRQDPTLNE
jgi:hypothetical protein